MAIFHFSAKTIGRSAGRSACAAAAYRAGEKITDERTGQAHDFTRKRGVVLSEIVVPFGVPSWATNRAELWNRVERAEDKSTRRAVATTAREFVIALPHELSKGEQSDLTREFARFLVAKFGLVVDFSIHEPSQRGDKRNRHAHLMLTDRRINEDGFAGKVRELNPFNGGKANLIKIRGQWAKIANCFLERARVQARIDHRSYEAQGIHRAPTIHMGGAATAMERRGEVSENGNRNRSVLEINALCITFEEAGRSMLALKSNETHVKGMWNSDKVLTLVINQLVRRMIYNGGPYMDRLWGLGERTRVVDLPGMAGHTRHLRSKDQDGIETQQPFKMTLQERMREAETKAKMAMERRLLMGLDYLGRDRGR